MRYKLGTLGWYNFEQLVNTLLKVVIAPGVQSFGGSRDGGRDATYSGAAPYPSTTNQWTGTWIFQSKHSELEKLSNTSSESSFYNRIGSEITALLKRRVPPPDNYILVTSFEATSGARDRIDKIVRASGYGGNFALIDGREVCEFLTLHPAIRRAFPQLLGLADLQNLIHADVMNRSRAQLDAWHKDMSTFVATTSYIQARKVLEKNHFVVLDGPPEVGKTMIAAAMSMTFAAEGFAVYNVTDPNQLFSVYNRDERQVFVADDVVGSIQFDPTLGEHWSRDLPVILKTLDAHHRLIWTARRYILEEALSRTRLQEEVLNFPGPMQVTVDVGHLTLVERAQILYAHAKQSNLPPPIRQQLKRLARNIAASHNFTPWRAKQVVSALVNLVPKQPSEAHSLVKSCVDEVLNDLGGKFERAYNSLGRSEQSMLLALFSLGTATSKKELAQEYARLTSGL